MKKRLYIALLMVIATVGTAFSQSMIITGGNDHGIALCSKGQIYAWGYNAGNRLCLKDANDAGRDIVPYPSLVNTGNLTFSQLSGGSGGHSVALSCKKVVYCWGGNDNMQCGRPVSDYIDGGEPVPVYCGEADGYNLDGTPGGEYLGNVKYISATTAASMAILDDGTGRVVIWGGNLSSGGGVIETPTYKPIFIRDAKGDPIKNVIHITGGDNNVMLIVGDSPDAKVGTVYSIGNWNGRGGNGEASSYIAAPVEIGDGTGKATSGKKLTNVRNVGISDVGAFAVDGSSGYVYGWGNGGWGCSNGLPNNNTTVYAEKVKSGEYEDISGEPYLTDVTQVIGGNGNGTAVTKEGYVLYWGCNDAVDGTFSGGVIPNSKYKAESSTCATGPVFANYCAGEHKGHPQEAVEHRVDDAVAIARGDLYGFMVNANGEFYVWGSTGSPGLKAHVGALGIGDPKDPDPTKGIKEISTCFKRIYIECTPQDLCPEVFMVDTMWKCPMAADSLYCGFTPLNGSKNNYFFQWTHNGTIRNQSKQTDNSTKRQEDPFNHPAIEITEAGTWRVDVYYIGLNVPCDNCPDAFAEIEVVDMKMPIDTLIGTSCVAEPFEPSSSDVMNYKFEVSTKEGSFYKDGALTTWDVYSEAEGGTPITSLDVVAGNVGEFTVAGDKVWGRDGGNRYNDNSSLPSKDTTYSVFLEDATKQEMHIYKGQKTTLSGSFLKYGLILQCWSDATLSSFDLVLKSYSGTATAKVTPIIYNAVLNSQGEYAVGSAYIDTISARTVSFGETAETVTIDCSNVKLKGNAQRGAVYILGMEFVGNANIMLYSVTHGQNSPLYTEAVPDDLTGKAVFAVGATANQYNSQANPSDNLPYVNLTFSKLTDYDCGRIELTTRYWCPPCSRPDVNTKTGKMVAISESEVVLEKDIELCKESKSVMLNIEKLLFNGAEATSQFDIVWAKEKKANTIKNPLLESSKPASSMPLNPQISWADIIGADTTKDAEMMYYVMVRDHDKPLSADCYVYDSIKIIAHPAPIDTLLNDTFCVGTLASEPDLTLDGMTIDWTAKDPTADGIAGLTESTPFTYTVTDTKTGCVSKTHTYYVEVNSTEAPEVENQSLLKDETLTFNLENAVTSTPGANVQINFYKTETGGEALKSSDKIISRKKATPENEPLVYWVEFENTVTGCKSERKPVEIVINDAPVPNTKDEHFCLSNVEGNPNTIPSDKMKDYIIPDPNDENEYTYNWYTDPSAKKGTGSATPPSFTASEAGEFYVYVSQTNVKTDAESEKAKITIVVHKVATLDFDKNNTLSYCIGDEGKELKAVKADDGDSTGVYWSDNESFTDKKSSIIPATNAEGTKTYYVRPYYENENRYKVLDNASEVCYGEVKKIEVTVNKTPVPESETNFLVQYMKDDMVNGAFKPVLTQTPEAVKTKEPTGYELEWFENESDVEPMKNEPTPPPYPAGEVGNKEYTYYVRQKNTATTCVSKKVPVTVVISGYPMPTVEDNTFCEPLSGVKIEGKLTAKIKEAASYQKGDFKLVWYDENPDSNPSAAEIKVGGLGEDGDDVAIDLADYDSKIKNLFVDSDGKKKTEVKLEFFVRQRHKDYKDDDPATHTSQSACSKLTITIYARPMLITHTPDAVCEPDKVDLSKQWEVSEDIDEVKAHYYNDANGDITEKHVVDVDGTYKVQGYFDLRPGETCLSDIENIVVTVHTVSDLEIDGKGNTCPNVGQDLTPVFTTSKNVKESMVTYDWKTYDKADTQKETLATGTDKEFFTTEKGLSAAGKVLVVDLNVQAGACPRSAKFEIEVGDGPVFANLKFSEKGNKMDGYTDQVTKKTQKVEFSSCSKNVSLTVSDIKFTKDRFVYKSDEGTTGDGLWSSASTKINGLPPGTYTVSYENECETSFSFTITDVKLEASETHGSTTNKLEICEGQVFWAELLISAASRDPYTIEWWQQPTKTDGTTTGASEKRSETSKRLELNPAKVSDSGIYTYKVYNDYCEFEGDIASSFPVIVKPNIAIAPSIVKSYEVTRGENKEMEIPFTVPATQAEVDEINDAILWKEDATTQFTGSKPTVKAVDLDHHYDVVIEPKGYCGTSVKVDLLVDARLELDVDVDTTDMCVGENHILTVDTTGTGKILHPDKLEFYVEEIINGTPTKKTMLKNGPLLTATVSPNPPAGSDMKVEYKVTYNYNGQGDNQKAGKSDYITVHPGYEIEWKATPPRVCEGNASEVFVTIGNKPEDEVQIEWVQTDEVESTGANNAIFRPLFTSITTFTQNKSLTFYATSPYCKPRQYSPYVTVDARLEGTINAPTYVCEGHSLALDASSYHADEYVWTSPDQNLPDGKMTGPRIVHIPSPEYATYVVEMTRGACTETDQHSALVTIAPKVQSVDSLSYRSVEIVLEAGTGTPPYQFIVDGNESDPDLANPVKIVSFGKHNLVIKDDAGCEIKHTFKLNSPDLTFQKEISPNGDGVQDKFYNATLHDAYPEADVRVFDRWGKEVARYKAGDNDGWDGTYNGNPLPSTDYWYEIQIKEIQKTYVGHFTLLRQ